MVMVILICGILYRKIYRVHRESRNDSSLLRPVDYDDYYHKEKDFQEQPKCDRVKNVVYIKTARTASSTLANIFYRLVLQSTVGMTHILKIDL